MTTSPQKIREIVAQLLFSAHFCQGASWAFEEEGYEKFLIGSMLISKAAYHKARDRALAILRAQPQLESHIALHAQPHVFERIPAMELAILRLCSYELLIELLTPKEVIMAEAVRLAKKFANPEASSFVLGVLNALHKDLSLHPVAS